MNKSNKELLAFETHFPFWLLRAIHHQHCCQLPASHHCLHNTYFTKLFTQSLTFIYLPTVSHGSSLCTQKSFLDLGGKRKTLSKPGCQTGNDYVTYLQIICIAQ